MKPNCRAQLPRKLLTALGVGFGLEIFCAFAAPTQLQYLSGTDKDHTVPWNFSVSSGRLAGIATNIPVPSCWEMQGFGTYQYGQNGSVSNAETGTYDYTFSVPADWAGQRVKIVFEGVFTDTEVLINGQPPGGPLTIGTNLNNSAAWPNDRAFDNSASTVGGTGGVAASTVGNTLNLGTLNKFSLTGWIKPSADFSSLANGIFPRVMNVGATANYDTGATNGVGFIIFNNTVAATAALQVKVNTDAGNGVLTPSNALTGSDWVFVAMTYDATLASSNVNIYVGDKLAALPPPVTTADYKQGAVNFGSTAYAYLLNRSARNRAFAGWGDDFRIFTNVLNQTALDSVRATAISNAAPSALATASYQWNFDPTTTGTTVTPVQGTGGVLTFTNSAGAVADLFGAVGTGVSGGTNSGGVAAVTNVVHRGGFYEFSYDVTTNLAFGATTNRLQVIARRWSTDPFIVGAEQKADYWNFGGIYRPVYLEAKPAAYIDRIAANPLANGQLTVSAFLGGITNNCVVNAFVTDTNGVQLGSAFSNSISANTTNVILSASLPTPKTWSSEFPNLYTLTVQLLATNGGEIHSVTNQIGFRTVTFTNGNGFHVNGKKILLRGANRHEIWPTSGRTTSRAVADLDIQLMKDMNLNAVRLSHYPQNKTFYEECDRLGLYVLDEFNSYQFVIDTANGARLIGEMVRRDVNHPCIFAWANGNEGGANGNLDGGNVGSTNYFALYDIQNRLVIRPNQGGGVFNNVVTDHYELYNSVTNYLRPGATTVFLPTEMLHGLYDGGIGACLPEFWDAFRSATNAGGMFLWALLDEGIYRSDQNAIDVKGQSAPDGILGPYREKEASYYACKSVFSPVQIGLTNLATFTGTLAVSNRFDFTDLNQCKFHWQLGWFFDATDAAENFSTNALTGGLLLGATNGNYPGPSLPPNSTGTLALPSFPVNWTNYDALRVTATDPFGNNIYTWTFPLRTQAQIRDRIVGAVSMSAPVISAGTNATDIVVTNGPRVFRFNKTSGVISSLTVSNQSVSFTNGPRPVAGSPWTISSVTNYFDGTNYIVLVNDLTSAANGFQWTLRPDGWLKLNYRYTLTGAQENIGVTFDYPSNQVTAMNWLGQGPYRVWKNRSAGQEIFSHTKTFNNTWTGQTTNYSGAGAPPPWSYPEFAGFHAQLFWATLQTTEQAITLATPMTNLFFRVLTPPATDKSQVNPTFPPGSLSLLHGISAIGDKFDVASTIGPSAATNIANGLYTGEASFFFGALPNAQADRDANGLVDAWELKYFGVLGQDALARNSVDGLQLMVENAFDFSPLNNNLSSPRLPQFAKGTTAPVALVYRVPAPQADFYDYLPQLSDDLITWIGYDQHAEFFSSSTSVSGAETSYLVQPVVASWPGKTGQLFLRLKIKPKP